MIDYRNHPAMNYIATYTILQKEKLISLAGLAALTESVQHKYNLKSKEVSDMIDYALNNLDLKDSDVSVYMYWKGE